MNHTAFAIRLALAALVLQGIAIVRCAAASDWKQTHFIAAPEAFQAAAADMQFVYAIGNATIAKYDRRTGQRIAVSKGPASHLNSGFIWEGKLYCAHSNYPQTPERSEIKQLDPQTMELVTFKEFANPGGSLTWAVFHDDHWWCNFARYGDENANTFLVKFDRTWQEQARFTYPAVLIQELGRYSLSGGIWRQGTLCVTGHDERWLYRLRLPDSGTVLESIDKQAVPFTGQGIAIDPLLGGLVGIDRARRQILFAKSDPDPPEKPDRGLQLRVLTYNIHHAEGIDGKLDLGRIARVIRSVEPDLVALQEVDRQVARSQSVDQPAELGRLTQMQFAFGGNIALQGGAYGNVVLSRWPIKRQHNHLLPVHRNGEQRGLLEVEVELPGGRPPLLVLATHFDHRPDASERLASAEAISTLLKAHAEWPAILAGDLNDLPDSPVLKTLAPQWHRANRLVLPTIPVAEPTRQIDYVLYRPSIAWNVLETRVLPEAVASDHRALLAVLELKVPLPRGD